MAAPFVDTIVLDIPTGVVTGDLMVAAIALTFTDGPVDPAVAVITPPTGWTEVLVDYPAGTLNWGDWGDGNEEIRLGIYTRVASTSEPATYTWDWSASGTTCPVAAYIGNFPPSVAGLVPSVNVAAAAVLPGAVGLVNPASVDSPSISPTQTDTLMLAFFVARNGTYPAPGGTAFTVPAGMSDLTPAVNLQSFGAPGQPFGMAVFKESIAATGATGVRTAEADIDTVPPNPIQGMGYAICIQGCNGAIPRVVPPGPG